MQEFKLLVSRVLLRGLLLFFAFLSANSRVVLILALLADQRVVSAMFRAQLEQGFAFWHLLEEIIHCFMQLVQGPLGFVYRLVLFF